MILQGDIVKIRKKRGYKGRIGEIIGYNPLYKEYKIKLLTSKDVICCCIEDIMKISI